MLNCALQQYLAFIMGSTFYIYFKQIKLNNYQT